MKDTRWPPDNVKDIVQKADRKLVASTPTTGKFNQFQLALLAATKQSKRCP